MTTRESSGAYLRDDAMSTVGYFIHNAMRVLGDMKAAGDKAFGADFELHDGMGEDSVVTEIVRLALCSVAVFNAKYPTEDGYWDVGVLDYDVWDSFEGSVTDEFYRVVVAIACGRSEATYSEVVDAYALRMGWLPGRGGVPLNEDVD